jgi:hypothetical protein
MSKCIILEENYCQTMDDYLIHFDKPLDEIRDSPICRIFPLERFLTSLNENHLFLVKTRSWEDPYEAFLMKQLIWKEDGSESYPFDPRLIEKFYGQCWTYLKESNFLWKIYAPHEDGIIVKSSLGKLYDLFVKGSFDEGNFFLGNVLYWEENKIIQYFEDENVLEELLSDKGSKLLLKSLFIKRKEFEEEKEVRLIYVDEKVFDKENKIIKTGFTYESLQLFNEIADELVLDPRINHIQLDSIADLIIKLGYKGKISKSTLFESPVLKLRVNNKFSL